MNISERIKSTKAQGGAIPFFIGAMIAVLIGLSVAWPVMDSAMNGGSGSSTTLTLSGNVTCGELFNVTDEAGTLTTFEINLTGMSTPCAPINAGHIIVALTSEQNTSTLAVVNISAAINAEADAANVVATVYGSTVDIEYTTFGSAGASSGYAFNETISAGTFSSASLSGGVADASTMPTAAATIVDQLPLFLVLILLMIFVKALI